MTISELIEHLQSKLSEVGDVSVVVFNESSCFFETINDSSLTKRANWIKESSGLVLSGHDIVLELFND